MDDSKIGFIDVGARGGTNPNIAPFHNQLHRVLVEPDVIEAEHLREKSAGGTAYSVIGNALGNADGEMELHVTTNPACSSALSVNHEVMDDYSIVREHFQLDKTVTISCARFDTLFDAGGLPSPHAVKIDVQGFEYQVLEGFGRHLNDCLAIELETHFYQIYHDQRTIGELVRFLASYDFVLRGLSNSRSPSLRGDRHFDGDLVEVDAFFTKKRKWLLSRKHSVRSQFRLACAVLNIELYSGF
jgi:FkbM family methyltransferase